MPPKKVPKDDENDGLLRPGKILPEVQQMMVKGESIDVIIGKNDFVYIDPDTGAETTEEDLKKKFEERYGELKGEKPLLEQYLTESIKQCKKPVTTESIREELAERLRKRGIKDVKIEITEHFVNAELNPDVIREIADKATGIIGIRRIWRGRKTGRCLDISNNTIKSTAARNVFGVRGKGIAWAVLDTGIAVDNEHISSAVIERRNFTPEEDGDKNGHGTHVAGIIASRSASYGGIAPEASLYDFKVLDKNGSGTEFALIRALEEIRKINESKGEIVIHGANISLGSPPIVGSYGVGATPVCEEADRLVNSGVIVCVAAGNDGHKILAAFKSTTVVESFTTFMDLTILDPGNAEEVITVGSVHKSKPHTYGISYFSGKGPTGDGRYKPDVVAPGERIKSLGLGGKGKKSDGVEMSGTSMATPHVSGALALFLCANREFIGQPRKVKQILMQSCTDLKRDRYFQGAGLIDVLRTIQAV